MRCHRRRNAARLLWIVLALVFIGGLSAQATERSTMAGLAHSERLRLYSLTRALDTRSAPAPITRAARQALVAQAFYHDARRPAVISTGARLTPVLAWDANINGGFLNDRFDHFGLIFEVD